MKQYITDNYTDEDVEDLHQTINELRDALSTIIDLCYMEQNGIWTCPIFFGGRVQVSADLNTALHRGVKAVLGLRDTE
jgi:hypothetical protein